MGKKGSEREREKERKRGHIRERMAARKEYS